MTRRKKWSLGVGIILLLGAGFQCFTLAVMWSWIGATPGDHDLQGLAFRMYLWLLGGLLCFGGAIILGVIFYKKIKSSK